MPLLHPGDTFPELSLTVPGGQTVQVPEAFAGQFGVMLFYRGRGAPTATPSCAPSSARHRPANASTQVAALSVDDEAGHRRPHGKARPGLPRRVRRRRGRGRGA